MKKILLDVDTGIDDALAIGYAVRSSKEAELLGITTSYGMAPVAYTWRNTKVLLELLGVDIPVWKGAERPLELDREYNGLIHGDDGLGNTLGEITEEPKYPDSHAVDAIIEQILTYKKKLTLVTTGPLTNLALAIKKEPRIIEEIGQVVSMGGALTTPGNVTKFAEANYHIDPHAAQIVYTSNLPITMVGLDITRKTLLTKSDVERWKKKGTDIADFFVQFTEYYLNAYKKLHPYLAGCALHDPLAIGVAIHPDFIKTISLPIHVDTAPDALGRTSEDLFRDYSRTQVGIEVNAERFMEDFFKKLV
ncbi:nucleoside hydrolase [Gracilibacillus sp. HCP3S3_G5_1]|uniref:nucleoside hydrolase n=1 Tax=unclassified Gracilibacillus TaxID=2625209 RepID=UPI003F8C2997